MTIELNYVDPNLGQDWRIISPQAVLDRMNELDRQVTLLNAVFGEHTGAIDDHPDGGVAFIRGWASFIGSWRAFYAEHQGWLSRFESGTVRSVERFAREYNAFEGKIRSILPSITTGTPSREEVESGSIWVPIAISGLVVAGIFGLAWLAREGRGLVREGRDIYETERARNTFRMPSPRRRLARNPRLLLPSTVE